MDLRKGLNAISDVVTNRPSPLREFDQIYMKSADMLLQVEHISRVFDNKKVIFIGDGDSIGLSLVHLHESRIIENGPKAVLVLDFDERVVLSIKNFAKKFGIEKRIDAKLYNVAFSLPKNIWQKFQGFYTNPPFGASNDGNSVELFIRRGIEASGRMAVGCIVLADDDDYPWTHDIMRKIQLMLLKDGFIISEIVPKFHQYHLDDAPDLTSCNMIIKRIIYNDQEYNSKAASRKSLNNFYGEEAPLRAKYIKDLTVAGKYPSRDYKIERLKTV